jgi:diguanylate cyclase (GGDEF)-like protein
VSHELRETSGMTSRLLLTYTQRQAGRQAVERLLAEAGCADREADLMNESTWFSLATKIRLFQAAAKVLDDPVVTRHAGAAVLDLSVGDGLKVALRALGSPRLVYQHIVRANGKFSAIHAMELEALGRDEATIAFYDNAGYDVHPLDCQYNQGLLSVVPVLFGLAPAQVSHPLCAAHGHDRCVYEIKWDQAAVTPRAVLGTLLAGVGSVLGTALVAPVLVPVAAGATAVGAGVLAYRAAREQRARWRLLELELADKDEIARRLSESLQNLVSELDLAEVLEKIVLNAHAAVASKQFVLLVDEDGVLRCRASTGLPDTSLALIESWAAAKGADADGSELVEDVTAVPTLAPLAEHPREPVGSLCLTPLRFHGATLGHLVALAPQARTFLPRDVDLVQSYAIQAAVALANARSFATQRALATRDPLTGLLNHREFHETVDRELDRGRRHGGQLTIALFDLDGFKLVNDGAGHAEGDRVLRGVATAMEEGCRASDMTFRIGGDEFALLLPNTGREEAEAVVGRVRDAISGVDPRVSSSVGIAAWPQDGGSKDVLLAAADSGLYAMKRAERRRAAPRAATAARSDRAAASELHRDRLAMASRLSARLAAVLDAEEIVRVAVSELHQNFDYRIAYVLRAEGELLRAVAVGGSLTGTHDVPLWTQRRDQGIGGRVARTGAIALVHDAALDPDHLDADALDPGTEVRLRAQVAVPLHVDGQVWGVLSVQDTERSAFGSDDVLLMETVAAQVSAALHRTAVLCRLDDAALARLRRDTAGPESLHY